MIAQFALRMIAGMSLTWALMPRRDVTSGFFRIQMLVTLGLSVLAALTVSQMGTTATVQNAVRWLTIALAGCSFLGSVLWTLERRRAGAVLGLIVFGLSATALVLSTPVPSGASLTERGLLALSGLSTAAMVGGFVATMLLGHWYLTATGMPLHPLVRGNFALGVFTGARFVISSTALIVGWETLTSQTDWLWLALRWGAGIIGPAILIVMVHRILKFRNTQSATGVLFVGVILTFIGELTATLLTAKIGAPF